MLTIVSTLARRMRPYYQLSDRFPVSIAGSLLSIERGGRGSGRCPVPSRPPGIGPWWARVGFRASGRREKRQSPASNGCSFSRINLSARTGLRSRPADRRHALRSAIAGNSDRTSSTRSGSMSTYTVVGSSPVLASSVPQGSYTVERPRRVAASNVDAPLIVAT